MPIIWKPHMQACDAEIQHIVVEQTPNEKNKSALQRTLDLFWVNHNFILEHFTTEKAPASVMRGVTIIGTKRYSK